MSLMMKKVQGKNGRGIGKIINVISLQTKTNETEHYALVGIPQLLRRSIIFPLNLTEKNPIVTMGGDHVFIKINRYDFLKIVSAYQKKIKPIKHKRSDWISLEEAEIANECLKEYL